MGLDDTWLIFETSANFDVMVRKILLISEEAKSRRKILARGFDGKELSMFDSGP